MDLAGPDEVGDDITDGLELASLLSGPVLTASDDPEALRSSTVELLDVDSVDPASVPDPLPMLVLVGTRSELLEPLEVVLEPGVADVDVQALAASRMAAPKPVRPRLLIFPLPDEPIPSIRRPIP